MKLSEIAQLLKINSASLQNKDIIGLATLSSAQSNQISFLAHTKYTDQLATTQAGAVLVTAAMAEQCPTQALIVADPYLAYAQLSHYFDQAPQAKTEIHPTAVIAENVQLGQGVSIGPYAVIEENCIVSDGVIIGAHVFIGANCKIGQQSRLHAHVSLYHGVQLGERVTIHSNSVIGADGFGFAKEKTAAGYRWQKIAQLGSVIIGNDVEIGASTTIDRGALDNTEIADGVIIDNQVQIAHNVKIGEATAIAGCVGISGSTHIGRYCTVAGAAGFAGHLRITDGVHISMQAQVTQSIDEPGSYSSGTGLLPTAIWRKSVARWRHFDEWVRRIKKN